MYPSEVSIWPKKIHFGPGSVAILPELLAQFGCSRAVVLCGASSLKNGAFDAVRAALGQLYAGAISNVQAHTPLQDVQDAALRVQEMKADAVISVGGGSVIDTGKGILLCAASGGDPQAFSIRRGESAQSRQAMPLSHLRHVCVPTTAGSGSDVMPTAGVRDPALGRKMLFWEDALIPDATILDSELATHAGPFLTATSGVTAVARAMEALYSKHRNPISTGLALQSLRMMGRSLPVCIEQPGNLTARGECQLAAAMASMASINAMASVVHAVGHVVGGKFGLQHGVAHAILLGSVVRRFASSIGSDASLAVSALRADDAQGREQDESEDVGERLQATLEAFFSKLPLPRRLRDVGLKQADIDALVEHASEEYMMRNAPQPVSLQDLRDIVEEAW